MSSRFATAQAPSAKKPPQAKRSSTASRTGAESPPMPAGHPRHQGLCTTCANDQTCTFPRDTSRPVLSCDEFDGGTKTTASAPPAPLQRPGRLSELFALANREWYPGLCGVCTRVEQCERPRPEGGVFSCSDFS